MTIAHDGGVIERRLHQFEIVSLLNLDPQDYDEAVALIPSLQRNFNEREIEEILTMILSAKRKI